MSFRRSFHNETIVKKNENDTSLINFIKKNDHFIMKTMTKNRKRFPKTIVNIIVNKFFFKTIAFEKIIVF